MWGLCDEGRALSLNQKTQSEQCNFTLRTSMVLCLTSRPRPSFYPINTTSSWMLSQPSRENMPLRSIKKSTRKVEMWEAVEEALTEVKPQVPLTRQSVEASGFVNLLTSAEAGRSFSSDRSKIYLMIAR